MKLALCFRPMCPWTTGFSWLNAMQALGLDFEHIDNRAVLEGHRDFTGFDALLMIDDGFALQQYRYPLPANSAFIGIDFHNGFEQHYLVGLSQFSHVYAGNWTLGVQLLALHGIASQWLPVAYDPIGHPYTQQPRDLPIAFVANWTTERRWFLKEIVEHKWKGVARSLTWDAMSAVLCRAQIALNDAGRKSNGDTRNDIINMRTMEILGHGALMFGHFPEPGLPDYDLLGLHSVEAWWMSGRAEEPWTREPPHPKAVYVRWKDFTQLEYTLEYFWAHPAEARVIAERGQALVRSRHTYAHRVLRVLADMLGVKPLAAALQWRPQHVQSMAYDWHYP